MKTISSLAGLLLLAATTFAVPAPEILAERNAELIVKADKTPAFKLSIPADAAIAVKGEKTTIETRDRKLRIYLWYVPGAKSVPALVEQGVAPVMKSEFLEFKPTSTEKIKLAGGDAMHLKGTGAEADDNDPGSAEVIVFSHDHHVFVACVHGEKDVAARDRPALLKLLETAQPVK
jgi:hypothetical protein